MRVILGAILSLAATGVALAADFPPNTYYNAPAPLASSWAGPYVGANVGYQWGSVSNNPTKPSGLAGGLEAGFNWQHGEFLYGLETDVELSGADDTFAPWQFSSPWFGTFRGRAGIAYGNVILFGTAGLAYGDLRADTANLTESHVSLGWAAGGGLEVKFNPQWSAKGEWLYLDLANSSYSLTGTTNGLATNLLRFGVNYHF
jgi:outer membrane immunogenic protein